MTFARLRPVDWVAFGVALALLFATAMDWYSTDAGRIARDEEESFKDLPPTGELPTPAEDRAAAAELAERNAWQADAVIDRLILFLTLATIATAVAAAFLRAAGRRFEPPGTPSGIAAALAVLAAVLVCYRLIQEPGLDNATTIEAGAPLGLLALGALAYASARALKNEEAGTAFREVPEETEADPAPPTDPVRPGT